MNLPLGPQEFDEWFPTLVRYAGVGIIAAFALKALLFGTVEYPSLLVAASGMILYPNVVKSKRRLDEREKGEVDDEDRWSHLP